MKRCMATAALALAALTLTGVPASGASAAPDPVLATQRQLVAGHGVRITERHTFNDGGYSGWELFKPVTGIVGFGNGKVVATDLRDYNLAKRGIRNICIGKRGYQYEPKGVSDGKRWVTYEWPCKLALESGHIRLDDPATFKAVLATTASKRPAGIYDGTRTTLYQGTITFGQLYKADPSMRVGLGSKPNGKYADWKVSWRLWVGQDQLVRRAWSSWREPDIKNLTRGQGWFGFIYDVRLSDWGMKADIKPPPADQTVANEDLLKETAQGD